eukprot:6209658-Pleurochrysis_carterae.AAC.2
MNIHIGVPGSKAFRSYADGILSNNHEAEAVSIIKLTTFALHVHVFIIEALERGIQQIVSGKHDHILCCVRKVEI